MVCLFGLSVSPVLHGFDRGLTLRLGPRPACRLVDMDDDGGLEQRESLEKEGIRLRSRSRGPPPPMHGGGKSEPEQLGSG